MEALFSYGTLQLESVQLETFGRKLAGRSDILEGYKLSTIKIRDESVVATSGTAEHPIIVYTGVPTDVVSGKVFEVTAEELKHADEYEVDDYKRVLARLKSGTDAWVYVRANC